MLPVFSQKLRLRIFQTLKDKMTRVAEVGERLGVVTWEDPSGRKLQQTYKAWWIIKNTM